ncbi:MAG TPA: hypothetical protein VFU15_07410 [Bacteroidia bacterium]|nr:hypothetical protein [Bacteroidia bacterium]
MRKRFLLPAVCALLVTCTTYDNAIIYHKNFTPGTNALLRFNGFYSDTLGPVEAKSAKQVTRKIKPVFFYADGSAFSTRDYQPSSSAGLTSATGFWGNYRIIGDTILLEKFEEAEASSNLARIILKGVVHEGSIEWMARKDRNSDYQPVKYSIYFTPFAAKPDSTQNWIRTKKKYNK